MTARRHSLVPATAGIVLVAMRLKSGSLLWPMVGHNLIGLALRLT